MDLFLVALGASTLVGVITSFLFQKMILQVNQAEVLAPINLTRDPTQMRIVLSKHQELYPESKLRLGMWVGVFLTVLSFGIFWYATELLPGGSNKGHVIRNSEVR